MNFKRVVDGATFEGQPHRLPTESRSPVGVIHDERPGTTKNVVIDVVSSTYGESGVTGSGLDVNIRKGRVVEDLAVSDAVERHASGKAHCFLR